MPRRPLYSLTLLGDSDVAAAQAGLGLGLEDVALILPHNVNVVSWQRLCQAAGIPLQVVMLDNVARTGHCFCTDPFLNYSTAIERGVLHPGDHYLMAAVGTGATFSAMIFRH
jgi:3-oxoacyl-[acyl-carrier-protein] synthase III